MKMKEHIHHFNTHTQTFIIIIIIDMSEIISHKLTNTCHIPIHLYYTRTEAIIIFISLLSTLIINTYPHN